MSQRDRDRRAWDVLRCLPRAHPFALWDLPARRVRCADIGPHLAKRLVTLLVWVITRKHVEAVQEKARDGTVLPVPIVRPMAFIALEDETGILESTWFPDAYRRGGALNDAGPCPCSYFCPSGQLVSSIVRLCTATCSRFSVPSR